MLAKQGYTRARVHPPTRTHAHTHMHRQICSICCYITATMVSWTRLSVTLYTHCLSCLRNRTYA
jgi:hypothetical protein